MGSCDASRVNDLRAVSVEIIANASRHLTQKNAGVDAARERRAYDADDERTDGDPLITVKAGDNQRLGLSSKGLLDEPRHRREDQVGADAHPWDARPCRRSDGTCGWLPPRPSSLEQRHPGVNGRAASRLGQDLQSTADGSDPFLHAGQAEAAPLGRDDVEADAEVADRQLDLAGTAAQ
jgi:hypothetical protein